MPPRFEVADDLAQAEMLREARRELLALVAADPAGGGGAGARSAAAQLAAQDSFESMVQEALRQRALFSDAERPRARARRDGAPASRAFLGIASRRSADAVRARFRADLARSVWPAGADRGVPRRQRHAPELRPRAPAHAAAGQDDGDPVAFAGAT